MLVIKWCHACQVKGQDHKHSWSIVVHGLKNLYTKYEHQVVQSSLVINLPSRRDSTNPQTGWMQGWMLMNPQIGGML